jgi:hypothetical protein
MSIATFAQLNTAIASWTHRDDLTSYLADFITMAESRIFSDLKVVEMEARTDYTPTSRYLTTPTRLTGIRRVVAKSSPPVECIGTSPDGLRTVYDTGSGTPSHYTVLGSEIEFNKVPNVNIEILHYAAPVALSDSATSNAVLTAYPQVYLAACMVQAGIYMVDDAMIAKWQGLYTDAVAAANRKTNKFHTAGPMAVTSA